MTNSAPAGCWTGWISVRMHTATTGNIGRRIIMPIKRKHRRRLTKSIMNTTVLLVTEALPSICLAEAISIVPSPYTNIWMRKWGFTPLSAQGNRIMCTEATQGIWKQAGARFHSGSPDHPNQKWCTDFTYLFLMNHEVRYNYSSIDLYNRSVIASITLRNITSDLAIRILQKALESQSKLKGELILHSDQGSQYASKVFIEFCESVQVRQSMSKAGYPYDNAPMERYFNTLENKCTNLYEFKREENLYQTVEEFAYVTYNHVRPILIMDIKRLLKPVVHKE